MLFGIWGTPSLNRTILFLNKKRRQSKSQTTYVTIVFLPSVAFILILKLALSYFGHSKSSASLPLSFCKLCTTSQRVAYKTIFLTIAQVVWGGRLGIYLHVANDLLSTSRDERETVPEFNSPLDRLYQKKTHIKYPRSKTDHQLNLGTPCKEGSLCLEHRYLQIQCELISWQPLKCSGQHNSQVCTVDVSIIKQ